MSGHLSETRKAHHARSKSGGEGEELTLRQIMERQKVRRQKQKENKAEREKSNPKGSRSVPRISVEASSRSQRIYPPQDETWIPVGSMKGKSPKNSGVFRRQKSESEKFSPSETEEEAQKRSTFFFFDRKMSESSGSFSRTWSTGRFAPRSMQFFGNSPRVRGEVEGAGEGEEGKRGGWSDGWLLPRNFYSQEFKRRPRKSRLMLSAFGRTPRKTGLDLVDFVDQKDRGYNFQVNRVKRESGAANGRSPGGSSSRIKRENVPLAKHDKLFSDWLILVGPTDWADFSASKEGAVRYRAYNLPQTYFGPGVYELGIVDESRYKGRKLRPNQVVPVYVGQAENIRSRLQQYGQGGSHLGVRSVPIARVPPKSPRTELVQASSPTPVDSGGSLPKSFGGKSVNWRENGGPPSLVQRRRSLDGLDSMLRDNSLLWALRGRKLPEKLPEKLSVVEELEEELIGPGLFTEVFERGFSMAFRWAKASSKDSAEEAERKLLETFDYPWNYKMNGCRRPRQAFSALEENGPVVLSCFCFSPPSVGASVALEKPSEEKEKVNVIVTARKDREFKGEGRASPRGGSISPRTEFPRSDSFNSRLRLQVSVPESPNSTLMGGSHLSPHRPSNFHNGVDRFSPRHVELYMRESPLTPRDPTEGGKFCGAGTVNGTICRDPPVQGRKRCSVHKGMKVSSHAVK